MPHSITCCATIVATLYFTNVTTAKADPCADEVCSSTATVGGSYEERLFDPVNLDTGWFPNGWDVQIRLLGRALGETTVDLDTELAAMWPPSMSMTLPTGFSGLLKMGYGLEVTPMLRIDVDIPIYGNFNWEGEIPLSNTIPTDLLMDGSAAFERLALGDAVSASGATGRVSVVNYELDDSIIDIPGITGVIAIEVQGELTTNYRTDALSLGGASLTESQPTVELTSPDENGFGGALAITAQPQGTVEYIGTIKVFPKFRVELLGFTIGELELFEWSFDAYQGDDGVLFEEVPTSLALPNLQTREVTLALDSVGGGSVVIENDGELDLEVVPLELPDGISAAPLQVPAGEKASLTLSTDLSVGFRSGTARFSTNDPDTPILDLSVTAHGVDPDNGNDAGAGCQVGSPGRQDRSGWLFLIGVVVVLCVERRRQTFSRDNIHRS